MTHECESESCIVLWRRPSQPSARGICKSAACAAGWWHSAAMAAGLHTSSEVMSRLATKKIEGACIAFRTVWQSLGVCLSLLS